MLALSCLRQAPVTLTVVHQRTMRVALAVRSAGARRFMLAIGVLVPFLVAMSAANAAADPRTPDGVPLGVTIPQIPGDDQAYEFGNCQSRKHTVGGWVCSSMSQSSEDQVGSSPVNEVAPLPQDEARSDAPHASRKPPSKGPKARASGYARYNFNIIDQVCWGVGQVVYGCITWTRAGYFNGPYSNLNQSGLVSSGSHSVRYDFNVEHYRSTSAGWEYRTGYSAIKPAAPSCTRNTTTYMVGNGQNWVHYNASGYDYYDTFYWRLRDCAVNNPSTPDGTFRSPYYSTKVYRCNSTECYFKGY